MDDEREANATSPTCDDADESAYDLFQRGESLLASRHHAQAAIVLERADRLEPGKASILEALGRAYFNSSQPEGPAPPSSGCSSSTRRRPTLISVSARA